MQGSNNSAEGRGGVRPRTAWSHERSYRWVRGDFRSTPDFGRSRTASTTSIQCHWHRRMYVGSIPKNGPNGCAWRTEIGCSEVGRSTKVPPGEPSEISLSHTFFKAIDISVLLPPSPGHQYDCEKYAITSAAYGNVVVTAGFRPWSYNSRPRVKSALPHNPAVDPVRADLSGCRACCVRASGGVEVAWRALSSQRRRAAPTFEKSSPLLTSVSSPRSGEVPEWLTVSPQSRSAAFRCAKLTPLGEVHTSRTNKKWSRASKQTGRNTNDYEA
jgi:hypothetical protein